MKPIRQQILSLFSTVALIGCSAAGLPEPIKVLENPTTGERMRFFPEIAYKVPADYDQTKHIAEWTAEKQQAGFTKEILPADDRKAVAESRAKNQARAKKE